MTPLHDDEVPVTEAVVRELLRSQASDLAGMDLRPFGGGGTDNVLWQIGESALGRFPRVARAEAALVREVAWLGRVHDIGLAVPRVICAGRAEGGYPFRWAVLTLLPGQDAGAVPPVDPVPALAGVVRALRAAPVPPDLPSVAAGRLSAGSLDFARRMAAEFTPEEGDRRHLAAMLEAAALLPAHDGPPVWTHGDLHPLNLLTVGGRLSAVIDWGSLGAGDPARDLICGWTMLDRQGRAAFRRAVAPDPAAWARARAFALVMAVQAIPYYRGTNARFRDAMRATLAEVLADGD